MKDDNLKVHAGLFLKHEIESRGMNKKLFANDIGIKPSNLSEIFSGKRSISHKLALYIERALFIDAFELLSMQLKYDLFVERISITGLNN